MENRGEILLYEGTDGKFNVQVRLENETVRLSQEQMAIIFGKSRSTINEHIKNIYNEGELLESETLYKFGNSEFQQKATNAFSCRKRIFRNCEGIRK